MLKVNTQSDFLWHAKGKYCGIVARMSLSEFALLVLDWNQLAMEAHEAGVGGGGGRITLKRD